MVSSFRSWLLSRQRCCSRRLQRGRSSASSFPRQLSATSGSSPSTEPTSTIESSSTTEPSSANSNLPEHWALAPTPSQPPSPQTDSLFFEKLPPEIRRPILIHAFGNRTLHIHCFCCHRARLKGHVRSLDGPGADHAQWSRQRAGIASLDDYRFLYPTFIENRFRRRCRWRLRGSVCHRNPPPLPTGPMGTSRGPRDPSTDKCVEVTGCCEEWDECVPDEHNIGAIGWLQSCQKA